MERIDGSAGAGGCPASVGLGPEMRPLGRRLSPPSPRRWPPARAGGLVWRLRLGLATLAPGGLGLTVRPYYEGLPIVRLDAGRTNGGESCRDSGPGRTVPGPKIATVERREARRPASSAGGPWRSRDRPDHKAGHGVRRSAPAPVGALPPSFLRGTRGKCRRTRRLFKQYGRRSVGFSPSPCKGEDDREAIRWGSR